MQLTKQGDYAIRTVLELSRFAPGTIVSTKAIAKAQSIPGVYLSKIVQTLVKAKILHTIRGAKGGVTLAISPELLNFKQVIEAVEGPIVLNRCVNNEDICSRSSYCHAHEVWEDINNKLLLELNAVTFAEVINKGNKLKGDGTTK